MMTTVESYQGDHEGPMSRSNIKQKPADIWTTLKNTLFVLGSTSIIFVALRNSLTFHLQKFWGASGDFWQQQWDWVLETFGDDPYNLFVYGSTIVGFCVFWGVGLLYTIMDLTERPKFIRRYKVQPGTNEPLDLWKLLKLFFVVNFNMVVIGLLTAMVGYYAMTLRGFDQSRQLPTFHWVLFELIVFILVEEIGFYYSHRLFHHRILYKHFHKLHHEWQAPIAITCVYAHPLEHVMSNLMPIFLGPLVLGSHPATAWLWFALALCSTLNAHSGYHLPFFPSPEAHDYHHLKFNQCYGVFGVLDLLHGTDDRFRLSKSFSRHIMMLSVQPPREAFPDDEKEVKKDKKLC